MTSSLWPRLSTKTKKESLLYMYYLKAHLGIKACQLVLLSLTYSTRPKEKSVSLGKTSTSLNKWLLCLHISLQLPLIRQTLMFYYIIYWFKLNLNLSFGIYWIRSSLLHSCQPISFLSCNYTSKFTWLSEFKIPASRAQ